MEIRLLGPVEVRNDSDRQAPAGRGERALLALLALSPGQVVATTTLIDALWEPEGLPDDPGNALQLRVSKLRRVLAALGAPDVIGRDGAGYRLGVEPDAVDVQRFSRLIEVGRRTGDANDAVKAYDAALGLWRGQPLIDFAGEHWTTVETVRLNELRLSAVAERAERLLTLGSYEQVAADIEPIVAEVPTREKLVGQLMTALFNAGRQAEALELFDRTRRVLADELGIDPSRELRGVMEQILRQDPAMTPVPAAESAAQYGDVAGGPRTNALPARRTSFLGRSDDVEHAAELLTTARLVTLVGPGGAGKTTLGVETARQVADSFAHGAVLVRFAAVGEGAMLPAAVADALGVSIEGGTAALHPRDVLVGHLRQRTILLLLDNCEHLIEAIALLVESILDRCPNVRILATSREALAVPGEVQLLVSPLPVPDPNTAVDELHDVPSVQLFLDRAHAVRADLRVDATTLEAVAVIARRLDGIPLAIELAAARVAGLSVAELAERVSDRFAILTLGSRTADARQQTLRAAVDWSHDLLTPTERILLRRLAVFRGGWTLPAAEAVGGRADVPAEAVLDLLDRLVRQSLVVAETSADHTRYRMLETLRQYAGERLAEAAETEDVQAAHANFFLSLVEAAEIGLRSAEQKRWSGVLAEDRANIRAALSWFIDTPDQADGALRMAGSLGMYWHMGRHLEGREALRRVMALKGGSETARARALQAVSLVERPRACLVHPSMQCAAAARESLDMFDAADDRWRGALSRLLIAVEGVTVGDHSDAAGFLEQGEEQFEEMDDDWGRAVAAFVRMETCAKHGDALGHEAAAARAISLFRELDAGWGLSAVLYHRGWSLAQFDRHDEAVGVYQEAIEVAAAAGVHNTVQWAQADLGRTFLALGRVDEAAESFSQAGTVRDGAGDDAGHTLATYGAAVVAQRRGEHDAARPLFEDAYRGFDELGVPQATGLALLGLGGCDEAVGHTAAAHVTYQRLLQLGESAGEVTLVASGLEGLARVAIAESDPTEGAMLLGRAQHLRLEYERPLAADEAASVSVTEASLRAILGADAFAAAADLGAATGFVPS